MKPPKATVTDGATRMKPPKATGKDGRSHAEQLMQIIERERAARRAAGDRRVEWEIGDEREALRRRTAQLLRQAQRPDAESRARAANRRDEREDADEGYRS
jgi:hypothetical protein